MPVRVSSYLVADRLGSDRIWSVLSREHRFLLKFDRAIQFPDQLYLSRARRLNTDGVGRELGLKPSTELGAGC